MWHNISPPAVHFPRFIGTRLGKRDVAPRLPSSSETPKRKGNTNGKDEVEGLKQEGAGEGTAKSMDLNNAVS